MELEKNVKEVIKTYEDEHPNIDRDFLGATAWFNSLVESGIAEKRGNRLEEATQRTPVHVTFNYL